MPTSRTAEAKRIAVIIRRRRQELHLTRSDLARRTGLAHSSILRLEEGTFAHPSPRSLKAIADGLELPVNVLLDETGWMPKVQRSSHRPHVTITYYRIPAEVARDIQAAVDAIATQHRTSFDIYYQSINRETDTAV